MSEAPIKSQIKLSTRKFHGVLRRLAKSDSSVINKLKVTVQNEDATQEKKPCLIAPSMFMNCNKHVNNHNSTINTTVNIIENLNTEKENSSPINAELIDYPDSSDFDEDDE